MTSSVGLQSLTHLALRFLPVLLASSLKASIIFAFIYAGTRLMKNIQPRLRHLLWLSAISSYLFILALSLGSPIVQFSGAGIPEERTGIYGVASSVLLPSSPVPVVSGATGGSALASPWTQLWPVAALLLWAAGAFVSSLRVILGRIQLLRLTGAANLCGSRRCESLLRELTSRIGINRAVRVWESPRCRVPFACRFFRPIIVLPSSMRGWPNERLRAVLLHELRHIKRGDSLIQAIAHAICSLFWFAPFVWTAYSYLYLEQEKACDVGVVENGVERRLYATCILDAARLCREPALFAGLCFPGRRKRILADRIHSIIRGGKTMKKGLAVFALAAFVVCALIFLSGAGRKEAMSDEEVWGKLVGEWVNMEYQGVDPFPQKVVIRSDYVGEDWEKPTDSSPYGVWKVKLKKRWTDGNGNTYCQYYLRYIEGRWKGNTFANLLRTDKAGKVLQFNGWFATSEDDKYPDKIDPELFRKVRTGFYFIYYR